MVSIDSTSYPFLAIAQHHGAPYALVLRWAGYAEEGLSLSQGNKQHLWRAVVAAVAKEKARRLAA